MLNCLLGRLGVGLIMLLGFACFLFVCVLVSGWVCFGLRLMVLVWCRCCRLGWFGLFCGCWVGWLVFVVV